MKLYGTLATDTGLVEADHEVLEICYSGGQVSLLIGSFNSDGAMRCKYRQAISGGMPVGGFSTEWADARLAELLAVYS